MGVVWQGHECVQAMKIVSWNVNGLRASLKNAGTSLKGLLDRLDADVICFQETKAQSQSWLCFFFFFFPFHCLIPLQEISWTALCIWLKVIMPTFPSAKPSLVILVSTIKAAHQEFVVGQQVATLYLVCKRASLCVWIFMHQNISLIQVTIYSNTQPAISD